MIRKQRYTHLRWLLWFGLFGYCFSAAAQNSVMGVITDAETQLPVEFATVTLVQGQQGKYLNYTLTDKSGKFSLPSKQETDSLFVTVSLLGYKSIKRSVKVGESLNLQLEQQVFSLKEVEIRPGRVWGRQDTINYDVSSFLSPNDESIKDVLRKLPGVDVSELTGKISYNGKEISNFYVEGMELMGGRYKQLSNSLQALSVDKVQILDNHQAIRMLKDKVFSEKVALNITLKPEFKDRWMGNISAGVGANEDEALWKGDGNAIQIGRNSQSAYFYKGNNDGSSIAQEQNELTSSQTAKTSEPSLSSFVPQLTMSAQLDEERLLFNRTHSLSGNRVYKLNETTQLRLNAGYIYDVREQDRGSESVYFSEKDSVRIQEQTNNLLHSNKANLQATIENNSDEHFLTNRFSLNGDIQDGRSLYSGLQDIRQDIETKSLDARNYLQSMWKRERYTFEVSSLVRYRHLPSELKINDARQSLGLNHLYTEQAASLLRSQNLFTQRYTAGFTGEISNLKDGYSFFAIPYFQWKNTQWRIASTLPVVWKTFRGTDFERFLFSPSFSVYFKPHYGWLLSASASHKESAGDVTELYDNPYNTDYRTVYVPNGHLSLLKQQRYMLYAEYKEVISEFFSTLSVSRINSRTNQMTDRSIEDGVITWTNRFQPSKEQSWNLNGTVSKGFFDLHLKASLSFWLSSNKGEQLNNSVLLPYKQTFVQCSPKINWSPVAGMEASYEALIHQSTSQIGSSKKEPLTNLNQKLNISYTYEKITAEITTEHYHNKISSTNSLNTIFSDLNLKWKNGRWQIQSGISNLFNKKQYAYTLYSALESHSSWLNIRPREFMVSAAYRF